MITVNCRVDIASMKRMVETEETKESGVPFSGGSEWGMYISCCDPIRRIQELLEKKREMLRQNWTAFILPLRQQAQCQTAKPSTRRQRRDVCDLPIRQQRQNRRTCTLLDCTCSCHRLAPVLKQTDKPSSGYKRPPPHHQDLALQVERHCQSIEGDRP